MPAASRHVFLAIASATALLTLACNQDRVTAPQSTSRVRPLIPGPVGNNSHPKNSPDLVVGQFKARTQSNGKTSTDSTFGFRAKWYTTTR